MLGVDNDIPNAQAETVSPEASPRAGQDNEAVVPLGGEENRPGVVAAPAASAARPSICPS